MLTVLVSSLVWVVGCIVLFFILNPLPLLYKRIVAGISALAMLIYGTVITKLQPNPSPHNQCSIKYTPLYVALGILSFISIGASVGLSVQNEIIGGLSAAFPSTFMISMVSHWIYAEGIHTPGKETSTMTTSAVYISPHIFGSISKSAYCILFAACYELHWFDNAQLGSAFATAMAVVVSWLASVLLVSVPIIFGLKYTKKHAESNLSMVMFTGSGTDGAPLLAFLDDYDDR